MVHTTIVSFLSSTEIQIREFWNFQLFNCSTVRLFCPNNSLFGLPPIPRPQIHDHLFRLPGRNLLALQGLQDHADWHI